MKRSLARALALAALALSQPALALPVPVTDDPPEVTPAPAPPLPTRPEPYVRPPSTARAPACAGSARDATCLGYSNTVGSRVSDNAAATLQPITNARPIPQKPDLLPLGPIIERDGQQPSNPSNPGNPRYPDNPEGGQQVR